MSATAYTNEFYEANWRGSLSSAEETIPILLEYIRPRRVVELGCGVGAWLAVLKEYGVEDVVGVDGEYVDRGRLLIPQGQFLAHDLSKPFRADANFDLAMALEVAEHLPESCAATFIESLTKLAPIVLFSAAIPFQGGTHHVNEQWPDYWAKMFLDRGFEAIDCLRSRVWENERVEWWYAQNMLMFAERRRLASDRTLRDAVERASQSPIRLVHPKRYLASVDQRSMTFRQMLSVVRAVTVKTAKTRARRAVSHLPHMAR